MSHLAEMNRSIQRWNRARKAFRAAMGVFKKRFPIGSRAVFDRGDLRMIGCTVQAYDDDAAVVEPDQTDTLRFLVTVNGLVFVPWPLLFTPAAAEEMESIRGRLREDQHGR